METVSYPAYVFNCFIRAIFEPGEFLECGDTFAEANLYKLQPLGSL